MSENANYEKIAEYEQRYLACLLFHDVTPQYFTTLSMKPEFFQSTRNREIYKAMLKLAEKGIKPVLDTLYYETSKSGSKSEVDHDYIAALTDGSISLANISFYETALINAWKKREANKEVDTFKNNLNAPANAENVEPVMQKLQEQITRILEGSAERGAFLSFDDYISDQAKKEYWREYTPELFGTLPFPDGTISAIGAAPGSGKSAALINLVRELLTTKPTNNPSPGEREKAQDINAKRKILFISAEMSTQDLADRLVHSLAWQKAGAGEPCFLEKEKHTNQDYWKALKYKYGNPPDHWEYSKLELHRAELYSQVIEEYIRPAWGGRLKIAYVRGRKSFDDIYHIILNNTEPGTLVLMDYLQLMPICNADIGQGNPRYLEIRHIMDMGIIAAEKTQSVIIAAAQLGREDRRNGSQGDDTQGWRESGDIEQTAWNLIKMTRERKEGGDQLSFRISKARNSGGVDKAFSLEWIPSYQYMANAGEKKSTNSDKPKKNPKGKGRDYE